MTDMLQLFKLVDQLSPEEREKLAEYLHEGAIDNHVSMPTNKLTGERILGLHPDAILIGEDFDDPLPDEFWLGSDAK